MINAMINGQLKPNVTKLVATDGTNNAEVILSESGVIPTPTGTKEITENGTFDVTNFASAMVNIASEGGSPIPLQFELIGEKTITLPEYTDTINLEETEVDINIFDTDYPFGIITVECDGTLEGQNDWGGFSMVLFGRYTSGTANTDTSAYYRGTKMYTNDTKINVTMNNAYGVTFANNSKKVKLCRKCHGSACPKIMGGNYTIRAYGMKAF